MYMCVICYLGVLIQDTSQESKIIINRMVNLDILNIHIDKHGAFEDITLGLLDHRQMMTALEFVASAHELIQLELDNTVIKN